MLNHEILVTEMSVWKKASKSHQKTHRERHQPEERKELGLLEKKKDYKKRAKDHNEKQATIKLLKKRALNKNPDEFYYHMINSKTKNGVHHEKDTSDDHTREQIQLMETQDIRYVNMKRTLEMRKIEKLQSQLHLIDIERPKNNHKYFFDSKAEMEEFKAKATKTDKNVNSYSLEQLSEKPLTNIKPEVLAEVSKKRANMYRDLATRIKREKELSIVQQKLDIKRHLLTKKKHLPPTRVQAGTKDAPPVYKWKFQRQR